LGESLRWWTRIGTVCLGTRRGTPAEALYAKYGYGASAEDIEMGRDLSNLGRGGDASGESA
jgi:hypothetical protein